MTPTLEEWLQTLLGTAVEGSTQDGNTARDALRDMRDGLELLIAEVKGKVLVTPKTAKYIFKTSETYESALPESMSAFGHTEADARSNLQRKVDGL